MPDGLAIVTRNDPEVILAPNDHPLACWRVALPGMGTAFHAPLTSSPLRHGSLIDRSVDFSNIPAAHSFEHACVVSGGQEQRNECVRVFLHRLGDLRRCARDYPLVALWVFATQDHSGPTPLLDSILLPEPRPAREHRMHTAAAR